VAALTSDSRNMAARLKRKRSRNLASAPLTSLSGAKDSGTSTASSSAHTPALPKSGSALSRFSTCAARARAVNAPSARTLAPLP
jgi:hypothetical protein